MKAAVTLTAVDSHPAAHPATLASRRRASASNALLTAAAFALLLGLSPPVTAQTSDALRELKKIQQETERAQRKAAQEAKMAERKREQEARKAAQQSQRDTATAELAANCRRVVAWLDGSDHIPPEAWAKRFGGDGYRY